MDKNKLVNHVKLCRRNLKSKTVKCCLNCPFEEEITNEYPEMGDLWAIKRLIEKERFK